MEEKITNYSDLKKEQVDLFPEALRVDMAHVLNKEIVIKDFKALPSSLSEGREFVVILAELEGKKVSFNSGEIVLKQLKTVQEQGKLPIRTTITREKGKRYYSLT